MFFVKLNHNDALEAQTETALQSYCTASAMFITATAPAFSPSRVCTWLYTGCSAQAPISELTVYVISKMSKKGIKKPKICIRKCLGYNFLL